MYITYCETCNDLVDIEILKDQQLHHPIYHVDYLGKRSFCIKCKSEVFNDDLIWENDELAKKIFEESNKNFSK